MARLKKSYLFRITLTLFTMSFVCCKRPIMKCCLQKRYLTFGQGIIFFFLWCNNCPVTQCCQHRSDRSVGRSVMQCCDWICVSFLRDHKLRPWDDLRSDRFDIASRAYVAVGWNCTVFKFIDRYILMIEIGIKKTSKFVTMFHYTRHYCDWIYHWFV